MLLAACWGAGGRRRERYQVLGGMPNFLPSLKTHRRLRDKREQLSSLDLVRIGVCLQPIQLKGRARPSQGGGRGTAGWTQPAS